MKIAFSTMGNDMDGAVESRFGRCANFLIYDTESNNFSVYKNESSTARGGAGIKAAEQIVNLGAIAIITGNVGPNAHQALSAAGVKIVQSSCSSIQDELKKYLANESKTYDSPSVESHHGV